MEEVGVLDRQDFIKALNDTNKGLGSPELLRLISEYEILVYLEEHLEKDSEKWKRATEEKVNVELLLLKEIVKGYTNTRKKLRIGNNRNIENFNL